MPFKPTKTFYDDLINGDTPYLKIKKRKVEGVYKATLICNYIRISDGKLAIGACGEDLGVIEVNVLDHMKRGDTITLDGLTITLDMEIS